MPFNVCLFCFRVILKQLNNVNLENTRESAKENNFDMQFSFDDKALETFISSKFELLKVMKQSYNAYIFLFYRH